MTTLKEKFETFGVDDSGDVVPLADFEELPVSNASITQGMANLDAWRGEQAFVDQSEHMLKRERERAVADTALANAGVYITLDEHRQNELHLIDLAADMSMYKGGEKGGYQTADFQGRYKPNASRVEAGARRNHGKIVHRDIPAIYKAEELKKAGFNDQLVDHDAKHTMRVELMNRYGGPEKAAVRAKRRKELGA